MLTRPRYEALDVARMLAAATVLVHHARVPMGLHDGLVNPYLELAVFVFFSLSGFLVFRPFVRGSLPAGEHLTRRLLRIFPAYLLALVVTLLLTNPYPAGRELQYALMIQLPNSAQPLGVTAVSWSLHVEVMFYLALPVLAIALATITSHRTRAAVVVALAGLSLAGFLLADPMHGTSAGRPLVAPLLFWAFVPGMLVAWVLERSEVMTAWLSRRRVTAAGTVMLVIALAMPRSLPAVPLLATAVGMALMIPGLLATGPLPRPLAIVAEAGRTLSYPVYLWHIIVIVMVAGSGITGWIGVGVALVLTLLFSAGSWLLVERPAISLSRCLTSPRRPVLLLDDRDALGELRDQGIRVGLSTDTPGVLGDSRLGIGSSADAPGALGRSLNHQTSL